MSTEEHNQQGGHTPFTPPPASHPTGQPQPAQQPQVAQSAPDAPATRPSGASAITITIAVFGGLALLGAGGTAAVAATTDLVRSDSMQTVDVSGVTTIDLDASASDMRVEFGDVTEAELSVIGDRGGAWTLQREGDELTVKSPDSPFGWWFGNWFEGEETAVLTLPDDLQGSDLDASLTLDAGSLDVRGEFGDLDLQVSAGDLTVDGSAEVLDVQVSAGGADILLDGVSEADLGASAGDLTVELTGSAPTRTAIDVSAGTLELTLPDEEYSVVQEVDAGTLDNELEQSSSARHAIEVSISAGTVTLLPGS